MQRKLKVLNNEIKLPVSLHHHLERIFDALSLLAKTKEVTIHFSDTSYFHRREGLHPVTIGCERDSSKQELWHITHIGSLCYLDETSRFVEPELTFNFKHQQFYQPDIQTCDIQHPEVEVLFHVWGLTFARRLKDKSFDDIYVHQLTH